MVVVPQSFPDFLVPHAHAHSICSLGLFSPDGTFHRMEDVDTFCGPEAREAVPALEAALEDHDAEVRLAAAEALNKIRGH